MKNQNQSPASYVSTLVGKGGMRFAAIYRTHLSVVKKRFVLNAKSISKFREIVQAGQPCKVITDMSLKTGKKIENLSNHEVIKACFNKSSVLKGIVGKLQNSRRYHWHLEGGLHGSN